MNSLDRKLIRDLLHMRGQIIAVALVAACGIASFVSMRSIYRSLLATQNSYYAGYRFADIFANAKRVPERLSAQISEIPGVAVVLFRQGGGWSVFVIENGKVYQRDVEIGHRTAVESEILKGLKESQTVITHPSNEITIGMTVQSNEKK